jgi:hypothetical protein
MVMRFLLPVFAALSGPALTGCAGIGLSGSGSPGSGQVVSEAESTRLELRLPDRAAVVQDRNTADVYLTDLSPATLDRITAGDLGPEVSGTLLHIRIFLNPKPGRTPIADTAASATARLIVVARGQVGVYDAAGFLMPGNSLRKGYASGTLRNAPTRLSRATPGFTDLLGSARMEVGFGARANDETADRIASAIRTLALVAEPVE